MDLASSYERCRRLHRAHGRTYYLATRLLPGWKRRHVHALYGFTRCTDDIVDASTARRVERLRDWAGRFRAALAAGGDPGGNPGGPWPAAGRSDAVLPAVVHTINVFQLDHDDFAAFLRSMEMDLTVVEYGDYDDLLEYMAGSAAAVGTMMLPILGTARGVDPAAARGPARELGLAFQLTNFIRDVGEDVDLGRVYLPMKDLAEFGVGRADLRRKVATRQVRRLIAYEVERAREHYARAAVGIPMLAPGSQACVRSAYRIYGGILDEVAAADFDVFARRATVGHRRRLADAARCLLTRPGTAEYTVPGPVPSPGPTTLGRR